MPFNKHPMSLRQWYGSALAIPHLGTSSFYNFVSTCVGVTASIVKERMEQKIRVAFGKVETAAADVANSKIYINQDYLGGYFNVEEEPIEDVDTIASTLMGIVVHEAAHFAYSPPTLTKATDYILSRLPDDCFYSRKLASSIANIVEDIFIEHEVDRRVPLISWTLDIMNAVMFPEERFTLAQEGVQEIEDQPESFKDALALASLLIYAKTREECTGPDYACQLFQMARSAKDMATIEERMQLALDIYVAVFDNLKSEEKKTELPPILGSGEAESISAAIEKLDAHNNGATSGGDVQFVVNAKTIAQVTNNSIARMLEGKVSLTYDFPGASNSTLFYIELKPPSAAKQVEPDQRYDKLYEVARQRSTANRPYGADRNRGNYIRKLHRIATDQKIFAEPMQVQNFKPMQVMVLVDCSGSMHTSKTKSSNIYQALASGIGAVRALLNARCSVALFGHTADSDGQLGSTTIFNIKDFEESPEGMENKAYALVEGNSGLQPGNNRDGDALLYVAKKFTQRSRSRLLIVISDGMPNSTDYLGQAALDHTKQAVDSIRSQGIRVLSISIEERAAKINNEIYGEENNVFNTDPNVIEQVIYKILTN